MKNKDVKIEISNRKSLYCELKSFDPGFAKDHDFVEIVEWVNGEGFDVLVEANREVRFSLSWGQYEAIKHLVKKLNKL